jgi:hypothetical protein
MEISPMRIKSQFPGPPFYSRFQIPDGRLHAAIGENPEILAIYQERHPDPDVAFVWNLESGIYMPQSKAALESAR